MKLTGLILKIAAAILAAAAAACLVLAYMDRLSGLTARFCARVQEKTAGLRREKLPADEADEYLDWDD